MTDQSGSVMLHPVMQHPLMQHPLMQNVVKDIETDPRYQSTRNTSSFIVHAKLMLDVNGKLIAKYGNVLFPDPSLYMTGEEVDRNGKTIKATAFDLKLLCSLDAVTTADDVDSIIDGLVEEAYQEVNSFMFNYSGVCLPHTPVLFYGPMINPQNFDVVFCGRTRFGCV